MEIVEGPVNDTADAMSVENRTVANVCVFNVNDYNRTDLFVRIEQTKDPEILLPDVSLLYVAFVRAWLRMYHFDYSRGT